ncbi:uncharacterized protein LOC109816097 [Cajanus cajan]|nr:uncharacterized protein LOC109816097 [Cajanus cajan]
MSFWKAFDTVVSDAEGVNEKYGELEAVYKKRKGDDNEKKSCVEKSGDGGMKRGRKRRKVEKEMGAFLERLVKRVMKQQEGLQKRLMEVIERMEKEREEWEERWRVRETEIQEREAIAKARERDLASWRDSSIVSTIEKISGQSFLLFSANLSTNHT